MSNDKCGGTKEILVPFYVNGAKTIREVRCPGCKDCEVLARQCKPKVPTKPTDGDIWVDVYKPSEAVDVEGLIDNIMALPEYEDMGTLARDIKQIENLIRALAAERDEEKIKKEFWCDKLTEAAKSHDVWVRRAKKAEREVVRLKEPQSVLLRAYKYFEAKLPGSNLATLLYYEVQRIKGATDE